jgi:hypothetical protein
LPTPRQVRASARGKGFVKVLGRAQPGEGPEAGRLGWGSGRCGVFAALPGFHQCTDVRADSQVDVTDGQYDQLGGAQTGLVGQHQQGAVAPSGPAGVARSAVVGSSVR